jgi:hypothetical protein
MKLCHSLGEHLVGSCTSTPPYFFTAWRLVNNRENFTFIFTIDEKFLQETDNFHMLLPVNIPVW